MNIGIYIYDEAEILDFSGPFEVFSTALRVSKTPNLMSVFLIGETGKTVTARGGYEVNPTYGISDHPSIDVLIVVGGVHTGEMKKPLVLKWIAEASKQAKLVASVCTGAFLLAEAGALSDHKVTTHRKDKSEKISQTSEKVIRTWRSLKINGGLIRATSSRQVVYRLALT